ncbi:hypothetical protein NLG97_g6158 [Lecanicillium saksenae]|uniref:Uncharacterized protein n=1 Tax=Lecanicillium saksenae TaxID=468837 RepID=A0ACC1QS31_9HYPO|nr:hypothetical protein NLG97_g6158 [Lecanicillium saksenae]
MASLSPPPSPSPPLPPPRATTTLFILFIPARPTAANQLPNKSPTRFILTPNDATHFCCHIPLPSNLIPNRHDQPDALSPSLSPHLSLYLQYLSVLDLNDSPHRCYAPFFLASPPPRARIVACVCVRMRHTCSSTSTLHQVQSSVPPSTYTTAPAISQPCKHASRPSMPTGQHLDDTLRLRRLRPRRSSAPLPTN